MSPFPGLSEATGARSPAGRPSGTEGTDSGQVESIAFVVEILTGVGAEGHDVRASVEPVICPLEVRCGNRRLTHCALANTDADASERPSEHGMNENTLYPLMRRSPLFQSVERPDDAARELASVVAGREVAAAPETVIISEGASDEEMCFIAKGKVSVHFQGKFIRALDAPTHVGELYLVDPSGLRSATVTAKSETLLWRFRLTRSRKSRAITQGSGAR